MNFINKLLNSFDSYDILNKKGEIHMLAMNKDGKIFDERRNEERRKKQEKVDTERREKERRERKNKK